MGLEVGSFDSFLFHANSKSGRPGHIEENVCGVKWAKFDSRNAIFYSRSTRNKGFREFEDGTKSSSAARPLPSPRVINSGDENVFVSRSAFGDEMPLSPD